MSKDNNKSSNESTRLPRGIQLIQDVRLTRAMEHLRKDKPKKNGVVHQSKDKE